MVYNDIIIDLPNLFYRAYYSTQYLEKSKKENHSSIYLAMRMIQSFEKYYLQQGGNMYFLFDNCYSKHSRRKEIDPGYKAKREEGTQTFYREQDLLHMLLLYYKDTFFCIKKEGYEADDLAFPLLQILAEDRKKLLVSTDMDWFRLLSDNVHVAKYEKKEYVIYTPDLFESKFGFYPSINSICLYKAFRGDSSDNIPPGVPHIPEKTLVELVKNFSSLLDIMQSLDDLSHISDNLKEKIKSNYARLNLNYNLVDFQDMDDFFEDSIIQGEFNPQSLSLLYKSLKINIEEFDPRLLKHFPKKDTVTMKNFFKPEKLPRI